MAFPDAIEWFMVGVETKRMIPEFWVAKTGVAPFDSGSELIDTEAVRSHTDGHHDCKHSPEWYTPPDCAVNLSTCAGELQE
jgi:hypothetical protein